MEIRNCAWELLRNIDNIPEEARTYILKIENLADSLHNSPREVATPGPTSESLLQIEIDAGRAVLAAT